MHYIGNLQAAIYGNVQALKAVPFSAIGEKAAGLAERLQGQAEALDVAENTAETLIAKAVFDGKPPEMDFLNAVAKAAPELEIAVIACVEYDTADPSGPEWYAYYSPAGKNTLWGTETPFDGFAVGRVVPTLLSVTDAQGKTHSFTAETLAKELARNQEDGVFGEEDLAYMLGSCLSVGDYPGIRFHIRKTPEDGWELLSTEEEDEDLSDYTVIELIELDDCEDWDALAEAIFPDAELQVQTERGRHFLDGDGNEYFPGWDWEISATREDWGFPEAADWIPFNLNVCFTLEY